MSLWKGDDEAQSKMDSKRDNHKEPINVDIESIRYAGDAAIPAELEPDTTGPWLS